MEEDHGSDLTFAAMAAGYSTLTLVQLVLLHDVVLELGAHLLFLLWD